MRTQKKRENYFKPDRSYRNKRVHQNFSLKKVSKKLNNRIRAIGENSKLKRET